MPIQSQYLRKFKLPDTPGAYLFKQGRKILYIGKATSLRDRVRSYFSADLIETRGSRIVDMVTKAERVSFQKTDSVLEALLLEAKLIKKYQPYYNTDGKDDKSWNYVIITDEDFPRVLTVRQKDLVSHAIHNTKYTIRASYGPFPHGAELREALKITRKIFPYRDSCNPPTTKSGRRVYSDVLENIRMNKPCFNRQIGLCPGVCAGEISKKEYAKTIKWLKMFFEGKKRGLVKDLEREMKWVAKREAFEQAAEIKRKIFALNHVQDIALIKQTATATQGRRIEAFDISHTAGRETVGVMIVVENGAPNKKEYRTFNIKIAPSGSDTGALKEILERRFRHKEWRLPDLIVVDGGKQQLNAANQTLKKLLTSPDNIPVVSVLKNEYHKPREILGARDLVNAGGKEILLANAEAHRFAVKSHHLRRSRQMFSDL